MKTLTLILLVLMLTGCGTVKEKTGTIGKFIDAIGSDLKAANPSDLVPRIKV